MGYNPRRYLDSGMLLSRSNGYIAILAVVTATSSPRGNERKLRGSRRMRFRRYGRLAVSARRDWTLRVILYPSAVDVVMRTFDGPRGYRKSPG